MVDGDVRAGDKLKQNPMRVLPKWHLVSISLQPKVSFWLKFKTPSLDWWDLWFTPLFYYISRRNGRFSFHYVEDK